MVIPKVNIGTCFLEKASSVSVEPHLYNNCSLRTNIKMNNSNKEY